MRRPGTPLAAGLLAMLALASCGEPSLSEAEKATIAGMRLSALPPLPPDPTNRFADDAAAAAFGATLFFDQGMSPGGTVACATCHLIDRQFQDDRPLAVGVATTDRRTMPLADAARNPFLFWDGRKDSLWSQALAPLENRQEHAGTRAFYAHYVAGRFRDRYGRIFGPLPDLSAVPSDAGPLGTPPQQAAWNALDDGRRDAVDRMFSNLGKAIAAFERSIVHEPTRFDRFAESVARDRPPPPADALNAEEIFGLRLFIGKANCVTCHNGPLFTDHHFHNTGVPSAGDAPGDRGRATGVEKLTADPFNCLGKFSDAGPEACGELSFMLKDGTDLVRAFKTPSLRGAAARPPYMHAGQIPTLEAVLAHYALAPASREGTSELHPLTLSERERAALVAFLKTLAQ